MAENRSKEPVADQGGWSTLKVFVARKWCSACHRCYVYYPQVFSRDEKGIARPRNVNGVDDALAEMALDAMENCPVGAIFCLETKKTKVVAENRGGVHSQGTGN
jgi:ferredoxin